MRFNPFFLRQEIGMDFQLWPSEKTNKTSLQIATIKLDKIDKNNYFSNSEHQPKKGIQQSEECLGLKTCWTLHEINENWTFWPGASPCHLWLSFSPNLTQLLNPANSTDIFFFLLISPAGSLIQDFITFSPRLIL